MRFFGNNFKKSSGSLYQGVLNFPHIDSPKCLHPLDLCTSGLPAQVFYFLPYFCIGIATPLFVLSLFSFKGSLNRLSFSVTRGAIFDQVSAPGTPHNTTPSPLLRNKIWTGQTNHHEKYGRQSVNKVLIFKHRHTRSSDRIFVPKKGILLHNGDRF